MYPFSAISALASGYFKEFKDNDLIDEATLTQNLSVFTMVLSNIISDMLAEPYIKDNFKFFKDYLRVIQNRTFGTENAPHDQYRGYPGFPDSMAFEDIYSDQQFDTLFGMEEVKTFYAPVPSISSVSGIYHIPGFTEEQYEALPDKFMLQTLNDTYICGKGLAGILFKADPNKTGYLEEVTEYSSLHDIDHTKDSAIGLVVKIGDPSTESFNWASYYMKWDEETQTYKGSNLYQPGPSNVQFESTVEYIYDEGTQKGSIHIVPQKVGVGRINIASPYHENVWTAFSTESNPESDSSDPPGVYISMAIAFPLTPAFTLSAPLRGDTTYGTSYNPLSFRNISTPLFVTGWGYRFPELFQGYMFKGASDEDTSLRLRDLVNIGEDWVLLKSYTNEGV